MHDLLLSLEIRPRPSTRHREATVRRGQKAVTLAVASVVSDVLVAPRARRLGRTSLGGRRQFNPV
jgi:hypothetical protein